MPLIFSPRRNRTADKSKTVIIIGAGPGGLAAALLCARAGLRVRVIERLPRVGGRCSALEAEGFRFDLGPTFFLYPQVLQRIYRMLGRDLMQEIPMKRLDPQYRVLFGTQGGHMDCTPNLKRMADEIARLNADDAKNVAKFIEDNRDKLEKFRPVLESPFLSWKDLLTWEMIKLLPTLRPWASVDGELRRYFSDHRTRLAFSFQSKYLGMSPFNCPSLFSILSYLEYDFGVWHPIGGCSAVSERMAHLARQMGVEFHLEEAVEKVLFEGRRAVGVKTTEGEYRTDALIINADFADAMRKLVPNELRRRWTDAKVDKKRISCSTFMMYLGLEGCYDHLPHHTIYTSDDYKGNLQDIEVKGRLSEDPSFYVQNATVTDKTLAPKGRSTLYVLAPVPNNRSNINWKQEAEPFRKRLIQQLHKVGITDLEKRIQFEKIITPMDWQSGYAVYEGATFNLAHTLKQMLHLRPKNRFDELDGVYLVGGGTHPGSGLPVIYESARITTRLLLQDFQHDVSWLGVPGAKEEELPLSSTRLAA